MNRLASRAKSIFNEKFDEEPRLYFSPGRINLIGEHVDYNDGFVMPAAINKGIYYAIALNGTDQINFYAIDFDEWLNIKIDAIQKMDSWKNYVLGVVNEFLSAGKQMQGFNCVFGGDIANGAGISSSAAVEGGLAFSLNEMLNFGLDRKELALLCQRAEHNYPGVMCGIMDQYANMFGKKDEVLLLDCQSITHQYLPLHLPDYSLVLLNTKVHHSLASSAYNQRRRECEEGLHILRENAGINSFRDVKSLAMLNEFRDKMPHTVFMRCTYVVSEILRTQQAAIYLREDKIKEFGKLMFETHEGLKNLYQVSCSELDFLVDLAAADKAVVGSRLMGGGFGGCTINIIRKEGKDEFVAKALREYEDEFNIDADEIEVKTADGVMEIVL